MEQFVLGFFQEQLSKVRRLPIAFVEKAENVDY